MTIVDSTPQPLATAAQFTRRFPSLVQEGALAEPLNLDELMVEATAFIEDTTSRRLAPFSGYYFSDRLVGIDPNEYGDSGNMPTDIYGSLGMSQAAALGDSSLIRNFYLDQTAPHYPELWTYSIESIRLRLTFGNVIDVQLSSIEGPQKDTGHVRLRLGTFAPEGTTIEVIYGGGYTLGIPASLSRLCLYVAAKFLMLDMEPQAREKMNYREIDTQISMLMRNWAKGT